MHAFVCKINTIVLIVSSPLEIKLFIFVKILFAMHQYLGILIIFSLKEVEISKSVLR